MDKLRWFTKIMTSLLEILEMGKSLEKEKSFTEMEVDFKGNFIKIW